MVKWDSIVREICGWDSQALRQLRDVIDKQIIVAKAKESEEEGFSLPY